MSCQHCQCRPIGRPRRLCRTCYYAPGVRAMYPATSKFGRRGPGNYYSIRPLPEAPTNAIPGTPEKVAILVERAERRLSLFHPQDAGFDGPPRKRRHKAALPILAQAG